MAFTIANLKQPYGDDVMYEPEFRTILETHIQILRYHPATQFVEITPDKVHQYEGDFYGLLAEQGVSQDKYWVYLRVNSMENPNQFGKQLNDPYLREVSFTLIVPPDDLISDLKMLYLSTKQ